MPMDVTALGSVGTLAAAGVGHLWALVSFKREDYRACHSKLADRAADVIPEFRLRVANVLYRSVGRLKRGKDSNEERILSLYGTFFIEMNREQAEQVSFERHRVLCHRLTRLEHHGTTFLALGALLCFGLAALIGISDFNNTWPSQLTAFYAIVVLLAFLVSEVLFFWRERSVDNGRKEEEATCNHLLDQLEQPSETSQKL